MRRSTIETMPYRTSPQAGALAGPLEQAHDIVATVGISAITVSPLALTVVPVTWSWL